jgi:secondary thiamine-phosphate synthase enzyme
MLKQLSVQTHRHRELIDVTARVQALVGSLGAREGVCLVYSPHTTAGVTINENADPDVATDLMRAYVDLLGDEGRFRHAEGNSGGHALTSLVGPSVLVPVSGGALALGRWQAIYFCEFDGPRQRTLTVQLIATGT